MCVTRLVSGSQRYAQLGLLDLITFGVACNAGFTDGPARRTSQNYPHNKYGDEIDDDTA